VLHSLHIGLPLKPKTTLKRITLLCSHQLGYPSGENRRLFSTVLPLQHCFTCHNVKPDKAEHQDHGQIGKPAKSQMENDSLGLAVNYVYKPLSQPTEIRVAVIEPSLEPTAPLRFSFHQARLEDLEGRYEAVSYFWGSPKLTYPVHHTHDGSQILVTKSLNQALRALRLRHDSRWLWADAMCINQRDNQEKAVQIQFMVDIFRGAKKVLAWIHESDEAVERGMRFIDGLSRRLGRPRQAPGKENNKRQEGNGSTGILHASNKNELLDVVAFLTVPYFRRPLDVSTPPLTVR
jgi:hypothetical protein